MHDDNQAVIGALQAGARGYLLKASDRTQIIRPILAVAPGGSVYGQGAGRPQIIRGILAVAAGESVYGEGVGRRISDFFVGAHHDRTAAVFPDLTDRERQVLELVPEGCGNHDTPRRPWLPE